MKKFFLNAALVAGVFAFCQRPEKAWGQCNLIPNGNFEQLSPNAQLYQNGNIYNPAVPAGGQDDVAEWQTALNSPDFFYKGSAMDAGITPHSLNGYIGLVTASDVNPSGIGPLEYVTLRQPISMASGGFYYGSFYAYSKAAAPNTGSVGTTPLAMSVTPGPLLPQSSGAYSYLSYNDNLKVSSNGVVPANSTWIHINGAFLWTGGSLGYVTLGNMTPGPGLNAYYYIDDVELYRVPEAGPPRDMLCGTQSVTLGTVCPYSGFLYQWYKVEANGNFSLIPGANQSTLTVSPFATTTYRLAVTLPTTPVQAYATTATVTVTTPAVAQNTIDICPGGVATLSPNCIDNRYCYEWYTGPGYAGLPATTPTIQVSPAGTTTYKLVVKNCLASSSESGSQSTVYSTSYTTVQVHPLTVVPQLTQVSIDGCMGIAKYHIDNYNSEFTYTISNVTGQLNQPQPNTVGQDFTITSSAAPGQSAGGSFVITVTGPCGTATVTVQVVFDIYQVPAKATVQPTGEVMKCDDPSQYFYLLNYDPNLKYTITAYGGANAIPGQIGYGTSHWYGGPTTTYIPSPGPRFRIKGSTQTSGATFTITVTNRCGTTRSPQLPDDEMDASWGDTPCGPTPASRLALTPNPATDEVLIQLENNSIANKSTNEESRSSSIRVMDSYGRIWLEQHNVSESDARLKVSNLPAGLYLVQVIQGKTIVSTQRLQINH